MIESTKTPHPRVNETAFIIINPIGIHRRGDIFEINGSTNIVADEKLLYYVKTPDIAIPILVPFGAPSGSFTENGFPVLNGSISIIQGVDSKNNHWALSLDTSVPEYELNREDVFILTVTSANLTVQNTTPFALEN